jgi:uncharacterized membrane protein
MLERLIIFILSLLLLFLSAWIYSIFLGLDKEKNDKLQNCYPNGEYIKRGKLTSLIFVIISALFVIISAIWLFMERKSK